MRINLSWKYWRKHKKRAASVIFAIAFSMAALTCATFLARSTSVAYLESQLDGGGAYDLILPDLSPDHLAVYERDSRFSETGVLYRGGFITSPGGETFSFGALSDAAVSLYHFTVDKGRYPERSGEITACRSFLEANGCAARVGNRLNLTLCDFEGNVVGEGEFTVVGVIEAGQGPGSVQRPPYGEMVGYEFPRAFLCLEDMPAGSRRDLLVNYAIGTDLGQVREELKGKGIAFYNGNRIITMNSVALAPITEFSEESLNAALFNAHKDFYAYALIPIFSDIVLLVAFVSIYNSIATSLTERKRQLAMLRCIGMERRQSVKMALEETFLLVLCGMAAGFVLGVAAYLGILGVQKHMGMQVYRAFRVNRVIRTTTVNPYIFPAASCFVCSFLAVLMPYLIEMGRSPIESMRGEEAVLPVRTLGRKGRMAVLGRMAGGIRQNLSCFIIVVTVVWAAVFGYTYFSAQSRFDNQSYQVKLENSQLMGLDYFAQRDYYDAICGNTQLNRHSEGVSPAFVEEMAQSGDVDRVYGAVEAQSTKAVYRTGETDETLLSALAPADTANSTRTGLEERYAKSREKQGYREDEICFNIPTLGVSADTLELLSRYLIEGGIDLEKLAAGEEVLILETGNGSPYRVGDVIPMTDVVIDDPVLEEYDFSSMRMPDGYEPDFYYDYTDYENMKNIPGYALGTRRDYQVTVGGRIVITDPDLAAFFYTQGLVCDNGFNLLCAVDAFSRWGLPDRNYTRLGVRLAKRADMDRFDEMWYYVMGNSRGMESTSAAALRRQMNTTERTNRSVFYVMIVIVVILGLVGIINSANLRIRRQLRTYSILRAIGFSRAGLVGMVLRQGMAYAAVGALTCFVPLGVFEMFRRIANKAVPTVITVENGRIDLPWQGLFPGFIDLFAEPVLFTACVVFGVMCLIILLSNVLPAVWIGRKNITEALRNDDF